MTGPADTPHKAAAAYTPVAQFFDRWNVWRHWGAPTIELTIIGADGVHTTWHLPQSQNLARVFLEYCKAHNLRVINRGPRPAMLPDGPL